MKTHNTYIHKSYNKETQYNPILLYVAFHMDIQNKALLCTKKKGKKIVPGFLWFSFFPDQIIYIMHVLFGNDIHVTF